MAVTLKDIAKEASVNVGSVSQVLNNHPKAQELRVETRERVLKIAARLGYHRNELARSIATGSSNVIAFISSDMGAIEYTGRIQKSVFQTASSLNYSVSFYQLTENNHKEIIRKMLEWRIAGIVLHTKLEESKLIIEAAQKNNIPVGIINHSCSDLGCIGATSDDCQGAIQVIKHLSDLGHRKIAYLTYSGDSEFLNNRHEGYITGMKTLVPSQEPHVINIPGSNYDSWCNSKEILDILNESRGKRSSAVFCVTDSLAMAFCRTAYMQRQRIPEDFSVIGFGDLEFAKYSVFPLTTIAQPFEDMSQVVTEKIIKSIKSKKTNSENIKLKTKLVVRKTTTSV